YIVGPQVVRMILDQLVMVALYYPKRW
ncbi:uncharacterized protein METZ01_LOCUS417474, partial [marine metagenome]